MSARKISIGIIVAVALLFIVVSKMTSGADADNAEMLSKIAVTHEVQDMRNAKGETKVVVKITNGSDKTFNGPVKINSLDVDGSSLAYDGFSATDLGPGKSATGITWLKVGAAPIIKTELLGGNFK